MIPGVNRNFYSHVNKNHIRAVYAVHSTNFYILHDKKTPELLDQARAHASMCKYYWNGPINPLCI